MAEFEGLDSLVRDALGHAAAPGDSTGVADAIRSRVASGDAGASAAGNTAPGWGSGVRSWLPWVGLIVVGALVGGAVGAAGFAGRPVGETTSDVPVELGQTAAVYNCIDGPVLGRVPANTRVLAVARSDDSLWLGVRDPQTLGGTVWVPLGDVSLDSATNLKDLPVGGACPTIVVALPAPVVVDPGDTTKPTILSASGTPSAWLNTNPATLTVTAKDNVRVTRVTVSWSGQYTGSANMSRSGSAWTYSFTPPDDNGGDVTFTFRAYDAAGNRSAPVSVKMHHQYFG